jgi:hypothetical protein
MIISASRRTDMPAFFPKETIEKIISMNNDEQKTLFKTNIVEGVVFWTKNARPIMPYLNELDSLEIPYYFQYTMNDYPGLEPNIPGFWNRITTFIDLSEMLGKHRVIWRYDPFLTSVAPVEFTLETVLRRFEFMGNCLYKNTEKLVFSFLDPYDKIPSGLNPPTKEEEIKIYNKILDLNRIWNLKICTCADPVRDELINVNRCIDPELFKRLGVELPDPRKKDNSQRKECWCYPSLDIGAYHTCKHNCLYCYAR